MPRHIKVSGSFVDPTRHIRVGGSFVDLGGPAILEVTNAQKLSLPSITGMVVSGGTQDGVYTDSGLLSNGRKAFGLLGMVIDGNVDNCSLLWTGTRWDFYITNANAGALVYYSLSDTATPDLATGWKNASDDTPASITVTAQTATPVGQQVHVTDGFVVSGAGTSDVNGFWYPIGEFNEKTQYAGTANWADTGRIFQWNNVDGGRWEVINSNGNYCYISSDAVPYPWLVTTWTAIFDGVAPLPTLTHPALQQLAAPGVDAMTVSGGSAEVNRVWSKTGTGNGKSVYGWGTSADNAIAWSSDLERWGIATEFGDLYYSLSDTPTPATATNWLNSADDTPATGLTVVASRYDNPKAAMFVSGGTQDGVYTINGSRNGRGDYYLLGQTADQGDARECYWYDSTVGDTRWRIYDAEGQPLYYSLSDVASPDLATGWKNASDDTPASISVASVTKGELDAGVTVAGAGTSSVNGIYPVTATPNEGFELYSRLPLINFEQIAVLGGQLRLENGNDLQYSSTLLAKFPWLGIWSAEQGAAPAPTVTRNDVASEANWDTT